MFGRVAFFGAVRFEKEHVMFEQESRAAAKGLMAAHGLRAQAVVNERIEEARQQGDASALERWRNVELAINELRRTAATARVQHG